MNRVIQLLSKYIQPHLSITNIEEARRARLLAILSLVLFFFSIIGSLSRPASISVFITLSFISFTCFILSRTQLHKIGAYMLTYLVTSIAYVEIYLGTTDSVDVAISSTVHISLVLASGLLSSNGFFILVIASSIATFATPLYSHVPLNTIDSIGRTGGITLTIGLILYAINLFRARLDNLSLSELQIANHELTDIKLNLEQRVEDRTTELQNALSQIEQRAVRLQASSEISQLINIDIEKDFSEILRETTQVITEKTGYYHTGIFISDQYNEFVVLKAASSSGGQNMLARQHQLKIGGTGIVGYVSQSGRARIALDTGADAVFFNNPDLPETRSEMALPLKVGTKVIGVLDIQSNQPNAFDSEDAAILGNIANQLALIIQNALILSSRNTYKLFTNPNPVWGREEKSKGYSYLPDGSIGAVPAGENALIDKALASGETVLSDKPTNNIQPALAIPVKVRDTIIGVIYIESSENNRKWSEDEVALAQAVSERAGFALENARLFEETEKNAERERVISSITAHIGESNKVENILHTTIQELGRTLGVSRTFIHMEAPSPTNQISNLEGQENE